MALCLEPVSRWAGGHGKDRVPEKPPWLAHPAAYGPHHSRPFVDLRGPRCKPASLGGPHVQASCHPVSLRGLTGNRDRVGAGVGVRARQWSGQCRRREAQPWLQWREEQTGQSRMLRGPISLTANTFLAGLEPSVREEEKSRAPSA